MQVKESGTRLHPLLWLGAGLALGILVGLAASALAAMSGGYLEYRQYALLGRHMWLWLAAYGAAGLGLAAGAMTPALIARGGPVSPTWRLAAAFVGIAALAVALIATGGQEAYRVRDALAPVLPRGGGAVLGLCWAWFFAIGLVLNWPLLALAQRAVTRRAATLVKAAAVVACALLAGLGIATVFAPPQPFNVLFITLDALRPDHLHCYGYHRDTSPNIDRLAARGVLFLDANANSSWTVPSLASIFTSKLPMEHGATTAQHGLKTSELTLAEVMRDHGYQTGGAAASGFVEPQYAMSQGFTWFKGDRFPDKKTAGIKRIASAPWITSLALKYLGRHRDEPFFLWLHFLKPHDPYLWHPKHNYTKTRPADLPEGVWLPWLMDHRGRLTPRQMDEIVALYDGEIRFADEHVGKILAELERLGLSERTLVILSADHGEEFMEHGSFGHHYQIYQEELRVPLIMAAPGLIPAGRRVATPVQHIDLMPTILELAGISDRPPGMRGQSLVPLLTGQSGYKPVDIVAALSDTQRKDDYELMRSIRRGNWKLLIRVPERKTELYDLASDPGERRNLAGHGLAIEEQLRASLARYRRVGPGRRLELSDEAKERLRGVGYLQSRH